MKRIALGSALTTLVLLAACGGSSSTDGARTKNGAITTVATTTPRPTTTAPRPIAATTLPATTSTVPGGPQCLLSVFNSMLTMCRAVRTLKFQWWDANKSLSTVYTIAVPVNLLSNSFPIDKMYSPQGATRLRVNALFLDDSIVEDAFVSPTSATVYAPLVTKASAKSDWVSPTTTTVPAGSVTFTLTGTVLSIPKQFNWYVYEWRDAKGPLGPNISVSAGTGWKSADGVFTTDFSDRAMYKNATTLRIFGLFVDGSYMDPIDVAYGGPDPVTITANLVRK